MQKNPGSNYRTGIFLFLNYRMNLFFGNDSDPATTGRHFNIHF
jgi:hypothetical protein